MVVSTAVISTPDMMTAIATPVRGVASAVAAGLVIRGRATTVSLTCLIISTAARGLR
jgi:hypothetical protein